MKHLGIVGILGSFLLEASLTLLQTHVFPVEAEARQQNNSPVVLFIHGCLIRVLQAAVSTHCGFLTYSDNQVLTLFLSEFLSVNGPT